MPDWIKRINKEQPQAIEADETLIAASYFQGRGSAAGQIAFGMVRGIGTNVAGIGSLVSGLTGSAAGATAGKRPKSGYNTFEGSIADQIPNSKGVMAVTDKRLVFFGYKQGALKTRVEAPEASINRDELVGWSYKSGKVSSVLNFAFSDESDVGIEIPRANKPDAFAAELEIPEMD